MTTAGSQPFGFRGPLLQPLARYWWLILIRGIAAIVFGVLAFVWPGLTLLTLVILFGVYAVVDGILAFTAAAGGTDRTARWWLVIVGIAGIAAGIIAVVWPGMTALLLITFIGAWSVVRGVFEIAGAIRLRREIDNEWMLILAGAASILFGMIVLIAPGTGALALVWLIGIYAVVSGIMLVGLSLRLRTHHRP